MLVVLGLTALAVAVGAAVVLASDILFLIFAAILLAILLRAAADLVGRWTGLGAGWALAVVLLVLAGLAAAGVFLVGSAAVTQFNQFADNLPKSVDQLRTQVRQDPWGDELLARLPAVDQAIGDGPQVASRTARFFSSTFGVAGNLLVLVSMTLYLAASPRTYWNGLLRHVPAEYRRRGAAVLATIGRQLRWWLVGRAEAMVAVGRSPGSGCGWRGCRSRSCSRCWPPCSPSSRSSAPSSGPSPDCSWGCSPARPPPLWAVGVYLIAQVVENYLVISLVQERTVDLPPALTIAAIAIAGALFGVYGLIVAAPLTVAVIALVQTLYLQDVIGEPRGDTLAVQPPASTGREG